MRIFIFFLVVTKVVFSQNHLDTTLFYDDLNKANILFESNPVEARKYYLRAANSGSPDALFYLAYRYSVSQETAIDYYSRAASKGHLRALEYAWNYLFYRANSLTLANPKKALNIYYEAKKNNPSLKIRSEDSQIALLEIAASFDLFNGYDFIEKYNIVDTDQPYFIWELAEKASRGEMFDNPSSDLVMQLIIKGGIVPAETSSAVSYYFKKIENNDSLVPFSICDHITSGFGMSYCTHKMYEKASVKFQEEIDSISNYIKFDKNILNSAFQSAKIYTELKAFHEEGHDGTGAAAWAFESITKQQRDYLELIKSIINGYRPVVFSSFIINDKILNQKYNQIINILSAKPVNGMSFYIDKQRIVDVQRLWLPYRDLTSDLFISLTNINDRNFWNNFLTLHRINDFEKLISLINEYEAYGL